MSVFATGGGEGLARFSSPGSKAMCGGVGLPRPYSPESKSRGGEPDGRETPRSVSLSTRDFVAAIATDPCEETFWPTPRPDSKARSGDPHNGDLAPSLLISRYWCPLIVPSHAAKELEGLDSVIPAPVESFSELENVVSCEHEARTPVLLSESEESDEPDAEDVEELYFKDFVEKFILAAYPAGINGAVATGPGQQEAATTPSASARSVETRAARQMTELEGADVVVSTGSGVHSPCLVAKTVRTSMIPRERWTWKHQTTEDGPNGLTVLSPVKKQPVKGSCMPTTVAAVMESNLRVQLNKDIILSVQHLIHLSMAGRTKFPNEMSANRLFLMTRAEGVLSEEDYDNPQTASARDVLRYCITEDFCYRVDDPGNMSHALFKLRNGGPLMGIIRISKNYDDCTKSGHIYKYDPDNLEKDEEGKPKSITHAVCIISFAIEKEVPYLECQDSHGDTFSNKGFLKIDVSCLSHLWSVVVAYGRM